MIWGENLKEVLYPRPPVQQTGYYQKSTCKKQYLLVLLPSVVIALYYRSPEFLLISKKTSLIITRS